MFHIGDEVRIKDFESIKESGAYDPDYGSFCGAGQYAFVGSMRYLCGKTVEITGCRDEHWVVSVDGENDEKWAIEDWMIDTLIKPFDSDFDAFTEEEIAVLFS